MSANFMNEQHVAKRRGSALLHTGGGQTVVFNGDFMRQFKQHPAHIKRRRPRTPRQHTEPRSGGKKRAGFSFSVPSPMTLAVVFGTLVISLLALNWDGLSTVSTPKTYTFDVDADKGAQRNLASYAGIPMFNELLSVSDDPAVLEYPAIEAPIPPDAGITRDVNSTLDLVESFSWSNYRVQKGDSVSKIASQFGISMDAVISSNEIKNARRLREGETLRIPNLDGVAYLVKKGDSLSKIAKTYSVPLEVILDVNDIRSDAITAGETLFIPGAKMAPDALKLAMGELFVYPIRKKISSDYGWRISPVSGERHFHAALDLSASAGTPVKATMDAVVSVVSVDRMFGNYIILSHANNYQSLYAHLSKVSVKEGEKIAQGGKIGEVGSTGLSTGPHLHFAVFKNGKAVNPLDLLH